MKNISNKPLYIYISGPYSATDAPEDKKQKKIKENIKKADEVARDIAVKGHYPFVPHTMMRGWEDNKGVGRALALHICKKWVERCDALYFIKKSQGAEEELKIAEGLSLPIYNELSDIPDPILNNLHARLSTEAINAYLVEYEQCMESYRHTYTTIWQAGSILAAVSAGIIAFASNSSPGTIPWWIQLLAPLPVLFWWWGIFIPMNRYGEWRSSRLNDIENELSEGGAAADLHMWHFRHFDEERKGYLEEGGKETAEKKKNIKDRVKQLRQYIKARVLTLKFIWRPRVVEVVTVFGFGLLFLEIFLLLKNWPEIKEWIAALT